MELFDLEKIEEEEDDRPKIAIVGKPNAGKSSLINNLLGENRYCFGCCRNNKGYD